MTVVLPRAGTISFPDDEGRHAGATDEWWYFNSHLSSNDGKSYGLAVCFFPSYILGILVDVAARKVVHISTSVGLPFRGSTRRLDIKCGPNWWVQDGEAPSRYSMHYEAEGLSAYLTMEVRKRPLLLNGTGIIREGLLGRSFYFAQTLLRVGGTISVEGRETRVEGKGWIDRQWGNWEWSGLGGWKWFSIQLDNNVEVAGIQIYHPLTYGNVVESFNLCDDTGTGEPLRSVSVRETAKWKSSGTGFEYGVGWDIVSPSLFELRISPYAESQEINAGLWEGCCEVTGAYRGIEVTGRAWVEQSVSRVRGGWLRRAFFLGIGAVDYVMSKPGPKVNLLELALRKVPT